jgi:outer membrane immunogenic protein
MGSRVAFGLFLLTQTVSANAADLPQRPTPTLPAPWTGFYVGVTAGFSGARAESVLSPSAAFLTVNPSPQMFDFIAGAGSMTIRPNGFNGGLQLGYRAQLQRLVVGGVLDATYLRLNGSSATGLLLMPDGTSSLSVSQSASLAYMASMRATVGIPIDNVQPYVTGGIAIGSAQLHQQTIALNVTNAPGPCVCWSADSSRTLTGWVVGGGLEYAVNTRVSFKAEYLYTGLGSLQLFASGTPNGLIGFDLTHTARFTHQSLRVGLNLSL